MNRQELLERYTALERDFSGIDLSGADLEKLNLSGINLSGANLRQTNLKETNLNNANLSQADLSQANLSDAFLFLANLNVAKLRGANLRGATLADANLEDADLTGADLTDANLGGASWFGANLTNVRNASDLAGIFCNSPDNPNLKLLSTLREACQGLFYTYGSESDYPYQVFLWEVNQRGEFNLEKLFLAMGHLKGITLDDFYTGDINTLEWFQILNYRGEGSAMLKGAQEVIQGFRTLMAQLEPYLTNWQVYRLTSNTQDEIEIDLYTYILIGQTAVGDWLGLSTELSSEWQAVHLMGCSPIPLGRDLAIAKPENQAAIEVLESASSRIERFENIDYLECFVGEIAEQRDLMLKKLFDRAGFIKIAELGEGFFGEDDQDNNEEHNQNQNFANLVKSNLTNFQFYRFSQVIVHVYLVGQTEDGDWIIIHTQSTET